MDGNIATMLDHACPRAGLNTESLVQVLDAAIPAERARWLDIWQRWPDAEVWAHPEYVALFAAPEERAICIALEQADAGILFPLLMRPLDVQQWSKDAIGLCDLTSAYGFGGPFGWGSPNVKMFWAEFERWARTQKAVSVFTRLPLFEEQTIAFQGEVITKGPAVVIPLEGGESCILKGYQRSVRENLRLAERRGVSVVVDTRGERLEEFLQVYYSTMERRGASSTYFFPRSLFMALGEKLPEQLTYFHATYENRVVSTELQLISGRHTYAFLGGTTAEGLAIRANPALRHSTNLWGSEHGKTHMVFGGSHRENDGLFDYKKRFAPHGIKMFRVGTCILDPARYQSLVDQRTAWECQTASGWLPDPGFFPAYRS